MAATNRKSVMKLVRLRPPMLKCEILWWLLWTFHGGSHFVIYFLLLLVTNKTYLKYFTVPFEFKKRKRKRKVSTVINNNISSVTYHSLHYFKVL